jgi:hypothetical protein
MLGDLLVSPVLKRVLCESTNFSFSSDIILAKLDRAELGDFDALLAHQLENLSIIVNEVGR